MEEPKVCFKRANSFMSQEAFHALSNPFRNFFSHLPLKALLKTTAKARKNSYNLKQESSTQ